MEITGNLFAYGKFFYNNFANEINNTILLINDTAMATSMITDASRAKEIATRFLEQYHSILSIKEPILENGIWKVEIQVSSLGGHVKTVSINAKTGTIFEYF